MPLPHLDERTRAHMLNELNFDGTNVNLSKWLSPVGRAKWVDLLSEAITAHDQKWLAQKLRQGGYLNSHQQRQSKTGKITLAALPHDAPELLGEVEFIRYYERGVCLTAADNGQEDVHVHRFRHVDNPRNNPNLYEGRTLNASTALEDLRQNIGKATESGLGAPNSGLTIKF